MAASTPMPPAVTAASDATSAVVGVRPSGASGRKWSRAEPGDLGRQPVVAGRPAVEVHRFGRRAVVHRDESLPHRLRGERRSGRGAVATLRPGVRADPHPHRT